MSPLKIKLQTMFGELGSDKRVVAYAAFAVYLNTKGKLQADTPYTKIEEYCSALNEIVVIDWLDLINAISGFVDTKKHFLNANPEEIYRKDATSADILGISPLLLDTIVKIDENHETFQDFLRTFTALNIIV